MKLALCGGTPAEATKNKIKKERDLQILLEGGFGEEETMLEVSK